MFEEDFADIFRGLPYYLLLTLPFLIICSPTPVLSSEFNVQRLSQWDLNGVNYGCRSSALSLEAKSLYTWTSGRHCVVTKLADLSIDEFREIRQKAGALVVLLPKEVASMSTDEKEHLLLLEQAMLAQPSTIPVYFSVYNDDLDKIIVDITRSSADQKAAQKSSGKSGSALSELFASISANGYQIIVSGASHAPNKNSRIPIIQGELAPSIKSSNAKQSSDKKNGDINTKLPLIIITAHLKTFGLYNEYPLNGDAAILMTIADLFSKMHSVPHSVPKYRLMFLLSESGSLLNFQGIKKWLDENVQLQNVDFVLCLDSLVRALNADSSTEANMYMHVSKPPKEGTAMHNFYQILKSVAHQYNNMTVDGVHKKINLADQQLAWEHERFSMKRMPAFTLSSLKSSKEPVRTTIFQDSDSSVQTQLQKSAKVIAESLARYIYGISEESEIFAGTTQISKNMIKSYLNLKSALLNNDLKNGFEKYLKNVKIIYEKADAREPDFMLYEGHDAKLNVYRVKPAVFDLFLTILICVYLALVYLLTHYFSSIYNGVCKMTKPAAAAQTHYSSNKSKVN